METFDDVLVKTSCDFMDKAKEDGKPFFVWHNTTRMHVFTYLPPKYQAMMNAKNNYNVEEAGMAQMDDSIGQLLQARRRHGRNRQHDRHLHDRQRRGSVHLAGRRHDAVQSHQGHRPSKAVSECQASSAGRATSSRAASRTASSPVSIGSPRSCAAAGNPDITDQLLKGVKLGDQTYKNHLDGYNQMDLLEGKGPSKRHELFYFAGPHLGALRIDDFKYQFIQQPYGWPGEKVTTDMPTIVNLRQDPFERTPSVRGQSLNDMGGGYMNDFYAREFWRFVVVQKEVGKLAATAIDYPPMQDPASFNLNAIKAKIDAAIKQHEGE